MKRNSLPKTPVNEKDLNKRLKETLFQYFYIFGVEPDSINAEDLSKDTEYLLPNFLKEDLLTKYPPFERSQSDIDSNIVMSHCFPNGYCLIKKNKNPEDEYFFFSIDNIFGLTPENKKLYFVCVIIYEPMKSYLSLNKKCGESESNSYSDIYVPKALCLSSFVSFPNEVKLLLNELLIYMRNNNITIPMEKIIESIIFGIPRPLKAYFYIAFNKIIPAQSKDIYFILREFNQYQFSSYAFQSIFKFTTVNILSIYKCILLEIPLLFFSSNKELLSNTIESFLSLIYPFEYQYPHVTILPDSNCGLIESEKSFIFGINRKLKFSNEKQTISLSYFKEMNLNLLNKAILICDIDSKKLNSYCLEYDSLDCHVVNFEDLGVYNENNNNAIDTSQCTSKDAYNGKYNDIYNSYLPERYTAKLKLKLDNYLKDNSSKSEEYGLNNNIKIGEQFFYYYLASIFLYYNNYLFNEEENIKNICEEILTKNEDEINIEKLFKVEQFLHDYKDDSEFFSKFFKTKIFKNFIIKKYLNDPLERYKFLHFDEKVLEKRNKKMFSRRIETKFTESKSFQSTRTYQVKPPPIDFSKEEKSYIILNKDVLLDKYYQKIDKDNKINYVIFPKLIYDNKFFKKEYKQNNNFMTDSNLTNYLTEYQFIEDSLKKDLYKDFFSIYNGDLINRYLIDICKFDYHNEVKYSLYYIWIIVFCMTFYYCDEKEKYFRLEELIRVIQRVVNVDEKLLSLLLGTIQRYGDEYMTIKIYELIKKINYGEFSYLCSKFKSKENINWDTKSIELAGSKLTISYFRDPECDEKVLSDVKTINYDIKSLKKRTFRTTNDLKEVNTNVSEKEKISFDLFFKCPNCKEDLVITSLIQNLENMPKSKLMICSKCKKYMEPVVHVVYGKKKNEFVIYSPIKLLSIAKELFIEYGPRIDLDELRNKHNSFFWNCVFYFFHNGLSVEMLLKYKTNDALKTSTKEKGTENIKKKKKKVFQILEFQSHKN